MERISGPYKGYYIAAYTVVGNSAPVTGYAKVCASAPRSVWDAADVQKLITVSGYRDERDAIVAAERKARAAIAELLGGDAPVTGPGELP